MGAIAASPPGNPQNWPGEPDGWQYTGKKWTWYPYTLNRFNRQTIWEYSQPYQGSNPEYAGQREDHYSDYTNSPDEYPVVKGRAPKTYDWERWMPVGDNFKVMQLGNNSEARSYLVGEMDCSTGIFYPVVDHTQPYFYTPMFTNRWGRCTGGGYVAAYLNELWGEPLSIKRLTLCDNKINGVPAEFSPEGNVICKISPYVGTVYQRYIFGPRTPGSRPSVGCEAVLYAWGWTEPEQPSSGQDYQSWFRNGELRFTRWYELSRKASAGNPPAPDNHEWWNYMCQGAWTGEGNWLYTGTFRAGQTVYQDQAQLPVLTVADVTPAGGVLHLEEIGATYTFPSEAFTDTVRIVEYEPEMMELPPSGGKKLVGTAFRIFAEHEATTEIVQPQVPYEVSIQLSPSQLGGAALGSLGLYYWDSYDWILELSSKVDRQALTVSATPAHFSLWAVMADDSRLYLPRVQTRRR
ncbi:MAG: hypothetical protein ACWGO1_04165 [Anaerolineales bacterium]